MGRVTLKDVSAHAGVSRATASLVVRGSDRISPATTERVQRAIAELGYVYDRRAAMLRASRSMTIGLIVPEIRNPSLSQLSMSVEQTLYDEGLTVLVGHSHDRSDREDQVLSRMLRAARGRHPLAPGAGPHARPGRPIHPCDGYPAGHGDAVRQRIG